jgi:hypothetical protein
MPRVLEAAVKAERNGLLAATLTRVDNWTNVVRHGGRLSMLYFVQIREIPMNRLAPLLAVVVALVLIDVAGAQYYGGVATTTYYAPATTYYAPATTAYYPPAPTTVYYSPPATVYYQRPLVGAGITRVGYAPVTYVAPTMYYAPRRYYAGYSPWWY